MVDVGSKDTTKRMARAIGIVDVGETAYNLIANNQVKVLEFENASIYDSEISPTLSQQCSSLHLDLILDIEGKCHDCGSSCRYSGSQANVRLDTALSSYTTK